MYIYLEKETNRLVHAILNRYDASITEEIVQAGIDELKEKHDIDAYAFYSNISFSEVIMEHFGSLVLLRRVNDIRLQNGQPEFCITPEKETGRITIQRNLFELLSSVAIGAHHYENMQDVVYETYPSFKKDFRAWLDVKINLIALLDEKDDLKLFVEETLVEFKKFDVTYFNCYDKFIAKITEQAKQAEKEAAEQAEKEALEEAKQQAVIDDEHEILEEAILKEESYLSGKASVKLDLSSVEVGDDSDQ